MARFNFEPVPEVASTGAPGNDYEHIPTSPEMFGGAIAGATEKLGQAGVQTAEHGLDYLTAKQQLTNEISASETNTWLAKNITDKFNAFGQLQGKAAQDALPKFKQDLEDLHQQAVDNAGDNLHMRAMIEQNSRYLTDSDYRYGTNYADQQWRTWQTKTATDRATEFGNQAGVAAQHGTWDQVDTFLNTSDDEIRKRGELTGLDSDSINGEVKKQRGTNVKNIVDTLSVTDLRTAQAVFDKYKDGMDAGSVMAVTAKLRQVNGEINGHQIADEETGRAPRGAPPAPIADVPASFVAALKRQEGFDPVPRWDVKQWTVGYGTKASGPDERPNQDQLEQRFNDAVKNAAKTVDSVNPHLDPGTRAALTSLTYETGDEWTRSGLGNQVRKGDLAGAQKTFLEYHNVAGSPNAAVAERRWNEAQWFGQAEAPAGSGRAPDKAQVFDRIIARTANDPTAQQAAIARMNQIYSVERADDTQAQVLFNQRVKDTETEAYNTGSVKTPVTENEFVQAQGFEKGRAAYAEYAQDLQLGTDVAAAAAMTPADRDALVQRYAPIAGSPGYAAQLNRQDMLQKELARQDQQRAQDPAGFATTMLPDAKAAFQGMEKVEQDPKATDDQRKIARANFAAVMTREQTRIGIDPADQRLLSKDEADALNKTFATIAANDDPQARTSLVGRIQKEASLWGQDNWPKVMAQLAPQTQPIVRAIAAGADPVAMTRLLALDPKEKPAAILKEQNAVKAGDLNNELGNAMAPFRASLVGRQVDRDYSTYYGLGQDLSALYVRDGMSANEAATKAFGDLIGNRYDFKDTWRIPKSAGFDADDVQAGTLVARQQLASGAIAIKPSIDDMAIGANNAADTRTKAGRDGRFVTAPDNAGLNLAAPDGSFVRTPDGKPLEIAWADLAKMGGTKQARAATFNRELGATSAAAGAF